MPRPWQVLQERWIFHDRWYKLLAERVALGDGQVLDDYFVGVFPDIALVLPVTADGQMLFVRQYKHGAREILIELPGGYLDSGEAPLAGARRELAEELGYAGREWRPLGSFLSNPTKERGGRVHLYGDC